MLLELFTRDGVGSMVARYAYHLLNSSPVDCVCHLNVFIYDVILYVYNILSHCFGHFFLFAHPFIETYIILLLFIETLVLSK